MRSLCWARRLCSGLLPITIKAIWVVLRYPAAQQLELLKDLGVLRYCQYYSVVFGGYVALALWMTKYYVGEYGLTLQSAAFLAACFSSARRRAARVRRLFVGQDGADKVTWAVMWVCWARVLYPVLSANRIGASHHKRPRGHAHRLECRDVYRA